MVGANGGSGGVSEHAVYSQYDGTDGVATLAAGQRIPISACCINGVSVPVVWQLVGTDGCPGRVSEYAVYGQDQVNDRIATLAAGQGVSISASGVNSIVVPVVWKLVGTDGCPGGVSENAVYGQDEVDNRITTLTAGQRISISASGINSIAIPVVWKLVSTNGCPGSISENAIYSQDQINDRVATLAAG